MDANNFTDYISMDVYLGDRLKKCKIGMNNLGSTPVLYIKSYEYPFFGMVSMLNGSYFAYDELTIDEAKILYEFLSKSPNDHDGDNCELGNCTNWLFILSQYLFDCENKNDNLKFILGNLRKFNDIPLVPRFDINSLSYAPIPTIEQWSQEIFTTIIRSNI